MENFKSLLLLKYFVFLEILEEFFTLDQLSHNIEMFTIFVQFI